MKLNQLLVGMVVFASLSGLSAQQSIRLRFEVFQNESLVSSPEIAVAPGDSGRFEMPRIGTIAFTPSFRNAQAVRLALDFHPCGRHAVPVVVMQANSPASISWPCVGDAFRVRVTWMP